MTPGDEAMADGYPRRYRASRGWKVLMTVMGLVLFSFGIGCVWYFGTGHEVTGGTQQAFMIALSLALAALGGWGLLAPWLMTMLVLHRDALEIPGLWRSTVIPRSDLLGFRYRKAGHTSVLALKVAGRDGTEAWKNVSLVFEPDAALHAWLEPVPDLDAVELAESLAQVEQDVRLGATVEERVENIARAGRVGRWLTLAAYALMCWFLWRPSPYVPLFLAVAAVPWLVLALCRFRPAQFRIADDATKTVRTDLVLLLFSPGMFLALRALYDAPLLDVFDLVVPAALLLALVMAAVAFVEPAYRRAGKAALMAFLMAAYALSVAAIANVVFDRSAPQWHRVVVEDMRRTTGKGARNLLVVDTGGTGLPEEVSVGRTLYARTAVGDDLCIAVHAGALGMPWYDVEAASACGG